MMRDFRGHGHHSHPHTHYSSPTTKQQQQQHHQRSNSNPYPQSSQSAWHHHHQQHEEDEEDDHPLLDEKKLGDIVGLGGHHHHHHPDENDDHNNNQHPQQHAPPSNNNIASPPPPRKVTTSSSSSLSTAPSTPPGSSQTSALTTATSLNAADALSVRRSGPEATILKLRAALDQAHEHDTVTQAALAKSDAIILELRSTVRQLKRNNNNNNNGPTQPQQQGATTTSGADAATESHSSHNNNAAAAAIKSSPSRDLRVGELQWQLERAHAQIQTADLVRKELEDTLEAEQYTWELRVQDQERQILQLTQDCARLLQQQRQQQLHNNNTATDAPSLAHKVEALEQERHELQACLDEALKELETVDAELASTEDEKGTQKKQLVEPLRHLYRLVVEQRGGTNTTATTTADRQQFEAAQKTKNPLELVKAIQQFVEKHPPTGPGSNNNEQQQFQELQAQCLELQQDLKAREESSMELRSSLKEAVALLKPLQDAVAKADQEKADLAAQLAHARDELAKQLQSKKPPPLPPSLLDNKKQQQHRGAKLRAKRHDEEQLKQMLDSARRSLHQQNQDLSDWQAQVLLDHAAATTSTSSSSSTMGSENTPPPPHRSDSTALVDELATTKQQLAEKEVELQALKKQSAEAAAAEHTSLSSSSEQQLWQQELQEKRESNKALQASLGEALTLLRPLQQHLEEAEHEKKRLALELAKLNKKKKRQREQQQQATDDRLTQLQHENEELKTLLHLQQRPVVVREQEAPSPTRALAAKARALASPTMPPPPRLRSPPRSAPRSSSHHQQQRTFV